MKRIIFAVHGFRTYGGWQTELANAIEAHKSSIFDSNIEIEVVPYDYGYFGFPQFFSPNRRKQAVEAWTHILREHWSANETPDIDIFAHSFGTYLVLHSLISQDLPDEFRVRNVIFAGSALPPDAYSRAFALLRLRVGRLINDCGIRDGALLATLLVYGTGMAGRLGLHGPKGDKLQNRYFDVDHSGYFDLPSSNSESHITKYWLPLLQDARPVEPCSCRPEEPGLFDRVISTLGQHGGRTSLSIYATVLTLVFSAIIGLWQNAESANNLAQKRAKEARIESLQAKAEQHYTRSLYNKLVAARTDLLSFRSDKNEYLEYVRSGIISFEQKAKSFLETAEKIKKGEIDYRPESSNSATIEPELCEAGDIKLDLLAAKHGVAMILRWDFKGKNHTVIYGGGPRGTWKKALYPRLRALKSELNPAGPLVIDNFIVPQSDIEYSGGAARMLEHLTANSGKTEFLITSLWFNSFQRHRPLFKELNTRSSKWQLPTLSKQLSISLNFPFDYFVASTNDGLAQLHLANGATITVLGPTNGHLEKLGYSRIKRLERQKSTVPISETTSLVNQINAINDGYTSPDISLIRAPSDYMLDVTGSDKSIVNLASMVLLFEFSGCKVLLPADANWQQIVEGLRAAGLAQENKPIKIDFLVLPHGGSDRNVSKDFFGAVQADQYIVFGDGRHGNPERKTMEWLFAARPNGQFALNFVNPIELIGTRRRKEGEHHKGGWNQETQGLKSFFDQQRRLGRDFTINERTYSTHLEITASDN